MAKLILTTGGLSMRDIEGLEYDPATETLSFRAKKREHRLAVEDGLGSYIKVYEDGDIEIIGKAAHCNLM